MVQNTSLCYKIQTIYKELVMIATIILAGLKDYQDSW